MRNRRELGGYDPNIGGGNCQGIAYGRVNGALVLFVAHHCRYGGSPPGVNPMDRSGQPVYGRNGTQIGTWVPLNSAEADHDLTFIYINSGSKPSNTNQIWRGPVSGSDWWTMTAQPSSSVSSCDAGTTESNPNASARNWYGDTAWQMAQPEHPSNPQWEWSEPYTARASSLDGFHVGPTGTGLSRNCTIIMGDISTRFDEYVESSSPVVKSGNTNMLFGHITGGITVTPIYHGIQALDDWFGGDTRLCITAAC